ncbi:uncharacterized protein LOC143549402 [Bidens hawaiensis]|uniref:uncharacterized protein LOC143549402 n=1 Tax=Bidens hawaiensis TaxID=980011 RepID=UPI004049559E
MEKNHNLLNIRGSNGLLPLSISVSTMKFSSVPPMEFDTVRYLYDSSQKMSGDHWTDKDKDSTPVNCVENDLHDVAVQILEDHPELARNVSLLKALARMPVAFDRVEKNLITRMIESIFILLHIKVQPTAEEDSDAMKILKIIWGHATRTMNIDEIEDMLRGSPTSLADGTIQYSSKILFVAAEYGNAEFIVELLQTYPDLVLDTNEDGLSIFHVAVMHRHCDIYNLLYEIGGSYRKAVLMLKDKSNNNMLHLVGKTSKDMTTKNYGASLLMQRELLWFNEVNLRMPSYLSKEKNKDGQTPYELFSKENEDQVSTGLQWMKDCMVVATLIVTVAFAVAFTVPGGYKGDNGLPFFIDQCTFLVFVTADTIFLFSSSTSLLVVLSILTSRHHHFDFFDSLPRKLMVGLLTLFISVAAMMVTFSVSFFVLYQKGLKWVPILITIFAALPVVVFARLQFPVLVDMFRSMYDHLYLFGPKKRMLYTTKPKVTL